MLSADFSRTQLPNDLTEKLEPDEPRHSMRSDLSPAIDSLRIKSPVQRSEIDVDKIDVDHSHAVDCVSVNGREVSYGVLTGEVHAKRFHGTVRNEKQEEKPPVNAFQQRISINFGTQSNQENAIDSFWFCELKNTIQNQFIEIQSFVEWFLCHWVWFFKSQ